MKPGDKHGRLTAIQRVGTRHFATSDSHPMWHFRCDCGRFHVADLYSVNRGHTTSCGCYHKEVQKETLVTHGDSRKGKKHPVYLVWKAMKQRCENANSTSYRLWGGRGIRILWSCYEDFKRDMAPTYQPGLEIERIDNNGHYCKENCKWATQIEQANNKRNNVFLEFNGNRLTLSAWERKLGFTKGTIRRRLDNEWTLEKTLTTPPPHRIVEFLNQP